MMIERAQELAGYASQGGRKDENGVSVKTAPVPHAGRVRNGVADTKEVVVIATALLAFYVCVA